MIDPRKIPHVAPFPGMRALFDRTADDSEQARLAGALPAPDADGGDDGGDSGGGGDETSAHPTARTLPFVDDFTTYTADTWAASVYPSDAHAYGSDDPSVIVFDGGLHRSDGAEVDAAITLATPAASGVWVEVVGIDVQLGIFDATNALGIFTGNNGGTGIKLRTYTGGAPTDTDIDLTAGALTTPWRTIAFVDPETKRAIVWTAAASAGRAGVVQRADVTDAGFGDDVGVIDPYCDTSYSTDDRLVSIAIRAASLVANPYGVPSPA